MSRTRTTGLCLLAAFAMSGVASSSAMATGAGTVAWGYNDWEQLGNGALINSDTPTTVCAIGWSGACPGGPYLSGISKISGGELHSLALTSDGTVAAWGHDDHGQLGNGTFTGNEPPVAVSGLTKATAVAAGAYHSLALRSNGKVEAWGANAEGQLGNGTFSFGNDTPAVVKKLSGVVAVAAGGYHNLALLSDGTVKAWGANDHGQLGNGTVSAGSDVPVEVKGLSGVVAISAGWSHSLAVLGNGEVRAWGANEEGELGDNNATNSDIPVSVTGLGGIGTLSGVAAVSASNEAKDSLALLKSGEVLAWGANNEGQLGDGTLTKSEVPVPVSGLLGVGMLTGVKAIAGGTLHSLALLNSETVVAWGRNAQGQLGNGTFTKSEVPVAVSGLSGVSAISAGGYHSLAESPPTPPVITKLKPTKGPASGGTFVTITGTGFTGATAVTFGSTPVPPTEYTVVSSTSITVTKTPAHAAELVDVTVTTPAGTSVYTTKAHFKFE